MIYSFHGKALNAYFGLSTDYAREFREFDPAIGLIIILWNRSKQSARIIVDDMNIELDPNQIMTTTYLQKVSFPIDCPEITAFLFNRPFYCIQTHDEEVSCNGIIFFGTQDIPIVTLDEHEAYKFDLLYQVFVDEFKTRDTIQGEMLVMLLKRLIIKITRLAKEQLITRTLDDGQIDIIRKFNVLVDIHYKEKRQVSDYADLLFKSPKTLSNLFSKYNQKSPLSIIHERIILEAKRLLIYSDNNVKQIAHELGFEDVGSFHKLFKKITHMTPQEFKAAQKTAEVSENRKNHL
jgi:AraC-like DNA-binding protein